MATASGRLPLTPRRAIATFGIGVVGFMSANLVPYMILALQSALETGATEAGTLMTGCLLATAVGCLAVARLTDGRGRILVARVGLAVTAIGFGVAALDVAPALTIAGVLVGGLGAGGAVAGGGAALAALQDPNRVSGISGLVNRALVSVVLIAIPLIGIGMGSAFGIVAAFALVLLVATGWLPVVEHDAGAADRAAARRAERAAASSSVPARTVAVAGVALLAMFALWAVGEDSLWAMSGAIGLEQAGMTEAGLGLVLSASTIGGLVAAVALVAVGGRIGRAVPLAILLALGAALKLVATTTTDPTVYLIVMIAWNTIYAVAFMMVVATAAALDASGRWSGPVLGVYLVGSSLSPLVGAWIGETFGFGVLGVVLAGITLVLLVPMVAVARLSSRIEREQDPVTESVDISTVRTAGV